MIIGRSTRIPAEPRPRTVENLSSPPPSEDGQIVGVSELMLTSLPPMMSGADIYMRQFYRGSNQRPFRRYLPLKGL